MRKLENNKGITLIKLVILITLLILLVAGIISIIIINRGNSVKVKSYYKIGDIVKIGEEDFYVIKNSDESTTTVTLLSKYCINMQTYKQDKTMGIYNEDRGNVLGAIAFNTKKSHSNIYANSTIKTSVDSYKKELEGRMDAGKTIEEARLMLKSEAEELQKENKKILYGTPSKLEYWIDSPEDYGNEWARFVYGSGNGFDSSYVADGVGQALRPVIVILKSNL